ncbi:MAG: PEP-CTERM sorting domain-containing protein [Phycisphaerae bacterium]|nr:PEP-CTERM sorting domain-containing protein [Phycisphaerae bacterium]
MNALWRNRVVPALVVCALSLASAGPLRADLIPIDLRSLADTNVTASSAYSGANYYYTRPGRVSDWYLMPGAFPSGPTGNALDGPSYSPPGTTSYVAAYRWMSANQTIDNQWIAWNLGTVCAVKEIQVWNENEPGASTSRGVKTLNLWTSSDGTNWFKKLSDVNWSTLPTDGTIGPNGGITIPANGGVRGTGLASYTGFRWVLPETITTRWIKFDVNSSFEGSGNGFVGLTEVTFFQVPEPATMAFLAIGGLAMAAGAIRRRRVA